MTVSKEPADTGRQGLVGATLSWFGKSAKQQANAARNARDWTKAAPLYEAHLASAPDDGPIWVQLGHARKEKGDLTGAEAAYRRAEVLMPNDADLHLQLGHLLKVMGRVDEAAMSYQIASRMEATSPATAELAALPRPVSDSSPAPVAANPPGSGKVYLPIDDLFDYLHHHRTTSGIQRVQLSLITCLLGLPDMHERYGIVFTGPDSNLWLTSFAAMRELVGAYASPGTDHDAVRRLIVSAKSRARPLRLGPTDTCFIVGAFWNPRGNLNLPLLVKRDGARLGIYFHDLIPANNPEYVVRELSASFTQSLVEALSLTDFAFSNSEYTAKEVERFVAQQGLRPFPISPVRLAHVQTAPAEEEPDREWPQIESDLGNEPYVLCVGTIEARKNHRYLFDLWKALIAEGMQPPRLVFVGRRGWQVDDFMAQLEATQWLDGRLEALHDVSDAELDVLYKRCLFTIFPSFVEGWGLPIGESLSHGKLCVASNAASMPEVGGDLVEYFDPWNLRSGIEVVRRLLSNPEEIERREAAIRAHFKPRGWDDFTSELVAGIARVVQQVTASRFAPTLEAGVLFTPAKFRADRKDHRFANVAERQQRLILAAGWDACEDFGAWMLGRSARLSFRTDQAPGTKVMVYLQLALVPSDTDNVLRISNSHDTPTTVTLSRSERRMLVRAPYHVGPAGEIALELTITGPLLPIQNDRRLLRVGLISLAYAALSDSAARAEIIESLLIGSGVVVA